MQGCEKLKTPCSIAFSGIIFLYFASYLTNMNRIDRISAILIQLQSKRVVKAQDIADRFGISLRTVYRDVNTLNEAGVPVIGEAGIGYSIADGYRLPPVMFTMEEATSFLTAEKLVEKLTDKKTVAAYRSALYKIRAILRNSEKDHLNSIEEYIAVLDNPYLPKIEKEESFLQDILKGIAQRRVIAIHYTANAGDTSKREVEPVGVFYMTGRWYLIAYCKLRNDYRNFRIDRIKTLHITDGIFQQQHPSLKEYLDQVAKKEKELHKVVLLVDKIAEKYLGDQKYYNGFVSQQEKGDKIEMTFLTTSIEGIARWYMMMGDHAEIVSPSVLKQRVKQLLSAVSKKVK